MTIATVTAALDDGSVHELRVGYEIVGDGPTNWVITPGGRFSRDYPGVREMATALAGLGHRVLIWDRPNTGESDICFAGSSESEMQATVLEALLCHLDMAPAIVIGGSGGARVSLLAAAHHREVVAAVAVWWISGGVYGLMNIAMTYGKPSIPTAWNGGMAAVADLDEWKEVQEKNPANRDRFLALDPREFIAVVERWMEAHCTCDGAVVPGVTDDELSALDLPSVVFRSGAADPIHTRLTSERIAALLPHAQLLEPPWPDTVWIDSELGRRFVRWPELAPILHDWAGTLSK
jgi:pimeloyl-ACP methyl ester carboxylesterase